MRRKVPSSVVFF
uniref:Uncharacterized protein n=1 Tax=Anopheles dirus TaxID=7168 RepID=A0A182NXR9_9DIPT